VATCPEEDPGFQYSEEFMRIRLFTFALIAGFMAFAAPAVAAPPEPVTYSFTITTHSKFGHCSFPVLVEATGKSKAIESPTGEVVGVSTNTKVTVTNVDSGKTVTYSVNGTFHNSTDADGNVTTTATGSNLLTDANYGVVITNGTFTFTFDKKGKLVQGLSGTGNITDVCAALS
jgi:hypothetical protein